MRFFAFDLVASMPNLCMIRHYRKWLMQSGTRECLMEAFDRKLLEQGYLAMGGQIFDATLIPAPKQCNPEKEKAAVKDGKSAR